MSEHALPISRATFVSTLMRGDRVLAFAALAMLALAVPTAILVVLDPRLFQGVSTFLKPLKFQVSIALYWGTLALFMAMVRPDAREGGAAATIRWTAIVTGLFEIAYITVQGARNTASHFNEGGVFEQVMFSLMGIGALLLTLCAGSLDILIWQRGSAHAPRALRIAVILGLAVSSVLGIVTGFAIAGNGSHWVGGMATDAGGLPVVGWSREGGDLRVAHFFALHAMQILPAAAALWLATGRTLRTAPIALAAGLYAVGVALLLLQAQRGQPFLAFLG